MAQPDRGAGRALMGFLCGLISFSALGLASIDGLARYDWTTAETLVFAAFLVAVVGLILSAQGRQSTSRRRLAIAGVVICSFVVVAFCVGGPVLLAIWATPGPIFH